jgi:hypothetical protein
MLILLIIDFDQSLHQAYRADGKSRTWLTSTYQSHRSTTKSDGMWYFQHRAVVSFEAVRDWECFDADTGKDSAREIREYFIPDFSDWKNHDAYQVAFQRLLRDLKADI